ncbi:MAG: regulatory protein NosR [Hyphomicrobiaceae bacterium]|nr:regulatory protein NosR [Hyphomicrobiaceae bacterium]
MMHRAVARLITLLVVLLLVPFSPPARAEDHLVGNIGELFPGHGGSLRSGPQSGTPPAVEVFDGSTLIGYAFSTRSVTRSVGYSGRPLDIHVGLGLDGRITGTRLVAQEEPILVIGIRPEDLAAFVDGLAGLDIRLLPSEQKRAPGVPDHVTGATVSSTVIKDAVLRSARTIAHSRGMLGTRSTRPAIDRTTFNAKSWNDLVSAGAIVRRSLKTGEVGHVIGTSIGDENGLFIELFATLLSPAMIGQNLLGMRDYERLMAKLPLEGHAILVGAKGLYSYKGVQWRQTGLFERIQLVQGARTLRMRREMYENVERLPVDGAPELREIGIFRLPAEFEFDPIEPWRLELLVEEDVSGQRRTAVFPLEYALPDSLILTTSKTLAAGASPPDSAQTASPRPASQGPENQAGTTSASQADLMEPIWVGMWRQKRPLIAVLVLMLTTLAGILFFHDMITRNVRLYRTLRLSFLAFTLVFLGMIAGTQLSIVNVITFTHALLSGFRWEFFLVEPLTFILWGFVALALLFWGRGVFCGWLCPFGALQELLNEGARKLGIRQIAVPWTLHERLWPIKYAAFLLILGVSFQSTVDAFRLAEIEPFKTTISLKFMRAWPYVVYALLLLTAGLFIERFYCRYLCPLGAALAIPAKLRIFEWLKRRPQCGRECRMCATSCTVQAINPIGQIIPNECIYCLQCQANYYDPSTCLPLKQRAARRSSGPNSETSHGT